MFLSRFIKSDKISTKNKSQQEVPTKRSYKQSNNYLLLNDVIFNFHDVKRKWLGVLILFGKISHIFGPRHLIVSVPYKTVLGLL